MGEEMIIDVVKKSAKIVIETLEGEKDTRISKQIRELSLKRETLKRKKEKSAIGKVELKRFCKYRKNELRQYNTDKANNYIQKILETTKSTKNIKKFFSLGGRWIKHCKNDTNEKISDRKMTNEIATKSTKSFTKKIKSQ